MASIKVKGLVPKPTKRGYINWYWQPNAAERKAGWRPLSLGKDLTAAMVQAMAENSASQR